MENDLVLKAIKIAIDEIVDAKIVVKSKNDYVNEIKVQMKEKYEVDPQVLTTLADLAYFKRYDVEKYEKKLKKHNNLSDYIKQLLK